MAFAEITAAGCNGLRAVEDRWRPLRRESTHDSKSDFVRSPPEHEDGIRPIDFSRRSNRLPDARWQLRIPFFRNMSCGVVGASCGKNFIFHFFDRVLYGSYFLAGMGAVQGSRWYHDRAKEFGIKIRYLEEKDFFCEMISFSRCSAVQLGRHFIIK